MSNTEKTGGRDANYWRRRMGLPVEEGNVGAGTDGNVGAGSSAPAPEPAPEHRSSCRECRPAWR